MPMLQRSIRVDSIRQIRRPLRKTLLLEPDVLRRTDDVRKRLREQKTRNLKK
jgi:hypothetical protein